MKLRKITTLAGMLAIFALLAIPTVAFAQETPDLATVASTTSDTATSLNVMWVLIASMLIFFMQAGFALVETDFTRAKNVAHTMMMNMMVFCIGAIGYWICGFAFAFGGVNHTFPAINGYDAWAFSPITLGDWTGLLDSPLLIGDNSIMGLSGFFLAGVSANMGVLVFFMFQMVFMDTAATIPTGSMAERLKFSGFVLMGLWVSMFIYPIVSSWVWGGGWLVGESGTHHEPGQWRS